MKLRKQKWIEKLAEEEPITNVIPEYGGAAMKEPGAIITIDHNTCWYTCV